MASRENNTPRPLNPLSAEEQLVFDQQMVALEQRMVQIRVDITRSNPNVTEIQSVMKKQLELMKRTLTNIGEGFPTQVELPNPFGLSVVVQAMTLALKTLVNIMKLVPQVTDDAGEELLLDANRLLRAVPREDCDLDSD